MGKASRSKGRRGEAAFRALLAERDWTVRDINSGTAVDDALAIDPNGRAWSVEVKNTASINVRTARAQAMRQAGKLPWLLACHIDRTGSWLVLRQGERPVVWHARCAVDANDCAAGQNDDFSGGCKPSSGTSCC